MSGRETTSTVSSTDTHAAAAHAFINHAYSQFGSEITRLYVFGSTVRGETQGLESDVDVLIILEDMIDQQTVTEALRDLAYDAMLEYGPVVELHILSEQEFDRSRNRGDLFIRNVINEGQLYA